MNARKTAKQSHSTETKPHSTAYAKAETGDVRFAPGTGH